MTGCFSVFLYRQSPVRCTCVWLQILRKSKFRLWKHSIRDLFQTSKMNRSKSINKAFALSLPAILKFSQLLQIQNFWLSSFIWNWRKFAFHLIKNIFDWAACTPHATTQYCILHSTKLWIFVIKLCNGFWIEMKQTRPSRLEQKFSGSEHLKIVLLAKNVLVPPFNTRCLIWKLCAFDGIRLKWTFRSSK